MHGKAVVLYVCGQRPGTDRQLCKQAVSHSNGWDSRLALVTRHSYDDAWRRRGESDDRERRPSWQTGGLNWPHRPARWTSVWWYECAEWDEYGILSL